MYKNEISTSRKTQHVFITKQMSEVFQSQFGLSVRRNKTCQKAARNIYKESRMWPASRLFETPVLYRYLTRLRCKHALEVLALYTWIHRTRIFS